MECCSQVTGLTPEDSKALSVWLRYEKATKQLHTCIKFLTPSRIQYFESWLRDNRGEKYAKRVVKRLRTAARRQGASLPSHLMDVDLSLFITAPVLSSMDGKEKTACRHYVRHRREVGLPVSLESITLGDFERFREWLFRQPSPGLAYKHMLVGAFRRYAITHGGLPETDFVRRNRNLRRSDVVTSVVSMELHKLVKPYLEYLRQQWAPSTSKSFLPRYQDAVMEFLAIVASHYSKPLLALEATDFFCTTAIEKWVASKPAGNPSTVARAIKGFLKFWSMGGIEQETLLQCIRLVETLVPRRPGNRVRESKSLPDTLLGKLAAEYVAKLRVRGFHRKAEATDLALRLFFEWCQHQSPTIETPQDLTMAVIDKYVRHLIKSYNTWLTTQHYLSMCRGYWSWLHYRGHLQGFREELLPRTKAYCIKPRLLTHEQVRTVIRIIQEQDASEYVIKRDLALVVLGLTTAARAVELQRLTTDDLDLDNGWVRYFPRKSKIRIVPLVPVATKAIRDYLAVRKRGETAEDDRYVFLSDVGVFGRRMGRTVIRERFKKYRELADIPNSVGNFHVLRHTCAATLAMEGTHPEHIRELLGHGTLSATNAYVHGHWNVSATLELPTHVTARGDAGVLRNR